MTVDEIISEAGGVGELAKLSGVSHSSVCDWRRANRIPVARALVISERLSIPLYQIRPDIWAPATEAA
jgi:DNA-binding transcriptional regulator YdaS (Cro superfamily)